jgi:hypothetical protein
MLDASMLRETLGTTSQARLKEIRCEPGHHHEELVPKGGPAGSLGSIRGSAGIARRGATKRPFADARASSPPSGGGLTSALPILLRREGVTSVNVVEKAGWPEGMIRRLLT